MPAAPDYEAQGLVAGLEGDARAARLELLRYLFEAGVPLDELKRAVAENRLALLPVELVLGSETRYTAAEVVERANLEDVDFLFAQRRAAGLPTPDLDARAFSQEDIELAHMAQVVRSAGIPDEVLLESARQFGEAAARAAAAARDTVVRALVRPGDTERDAGLRFAQAAETLAGPSGQLLQRLYLLHLQDQIRSEVVELTALAEGLAVHTREVAVCFADLVGFTRLGEQIPPEDLGSVANRLSVLAAETAKPPVKLVKLIGDAAMLVSPDPKSLLDAALRLVDAADGEGEQFPQLRAGVALGEALSRWGDWYGSPVNTASRLAGLARPASVLATGAVREHAREDFSWSFAGSRRLKGIGSEVTLFRCRRTA